MSNKSIQSKIITAIQSVDEELHNNHPLKGKWITIIGDCFSAFNGRTGSITGFTAYPNYGSDQIDTVKGMWWYKLIEDTGARLCKVLASPDWDVNQWSRYSSSWWIKAGETYTDLDGVQHEGPSADIYPDIFIIMTGGNYLKVITETGGKAGFYQNNTGLPDEFTYTKYKSSNGTGDYVTWKGYLNRIVTDVENKISATDKHIDIYICDPTYYWYNSTNSYDPTNDDRKYQLSKIVDMVCEFWDVKRIPTNSYFRAGNYGAGCDTCSVSGGTGTTFYLPNLNGMARIAKGIENYMEYLPHYKSVSVAADDTTIDTTYDETTNPAASNQIYAETVIDPGSNNEGAGTDSGGTIPDVDPVTEEEDTTSGN